MSCCASRWHTENCFILSILKNGLWSSPEMLEQLVVSGSVGKMYVPTVDWMSERDILSPSSSHYELRCNG